MRIPKKKYFYQRIIGYLIEVEDINEVEIVITQMFMVMFNEYIYDDNIKKTKHNLINLGNEYEKVFDSNIVCEADYDSDCLDDSISKLSSKFRKWLKKIAVKVKKNHVVNAENASKYNENPDENYYAAEKLEKPMIEILAKLPLFGNVLNGLFDSNKTTASTACTEVQFRNVKHHLFQKKKGMRLDFWLYKSIKFTRGDFLMIWIIV